jgi:hypothetical protein
MLKKSSCWMGEDIGEGEIRGSQREGFLLIILKEEY